MLRNPRTGAVLAHRVERASSPRARLRGLLGRRSFSDGEALVLEPCTAVHTFFLRFEIDAAFLSAELRVIRAISGLKPWRATGFYPRAAMVVELPGGTLARSGTREGDVLTMDG
jgi:uncharacterized membrane protein (UPF0127 family)